MANILSPNNSTPPLVAPNSNPAANGSGDTPVNTGKQYEVNTLEPEDLDMIWTRWKCMVCNYTYEGMKPLKKCPRCGNEDADKFVDAD